MAVDVYVAGWAAGEGEGVGVGVGVGVGAWQLTKWIMIRPSFLCAALFAR